MKSDSVVQVAGSSLAMSSYYIRDFFLDDPDGVLNESQNAMGLEITFGEVKGRPDDASALYRMVMNVYVDAGPEEPTSDSPCRLGVIGEFCVQSQEDVAADETRDHLRVEGAQELYAMAKSTMASLTALAPTGAIVLPSVSFGLSD